MRTGERVYPLCDGIEQPIDLEFVFFFFFEKKSAFFILVQRAQTGIVSPWYTTFSGYIGIIIVRNTTTQRTIHAITIYLFFFSLYPVRNQDAKDLSV